MNYCADCEYWKALPNKLFGDCVRYPPNEDGEFPTVRRDRECGEFKSGANTPNLKEDDA